MTFFNPFLSNLLNRWYKDTDIQYKVTEKVGHKSDTDEEMLLCKI